MSIVTRALDLPPMVSLAEGVDIAMLPPPDLLLRSGGEQSPASVPGPGEGLAVDALRLTHLLACPHGRPSRWPAPSFVREVDLVRSHLRPIRTAASLAASFGREAFHGRPLPGTDAALAASAVRIAYVIRWLELCDARPRPSWRSLLEGATLD